MSFLRHIGCKCACIVFGLISIAGCNDYLTDPCITKDKLELVYGELLDDVENGGKPNRLTIPVEIQEIEHIVGELDHPELTKRASDLVTGISEASDNEVFFNHSSQKQTIWHWKRESEHPNPRNVVNGMYKEASPHTKGTGIKRGFSEYDDGSKYERLMYHRFEKISEVSYRKIGVIADYGLVLDRVCAKPQ